MGFHVVAKNKATDQCFVMSVEGPPDAKAAKEHVESTPVSRGAPLGFAVVSVEKDHESAAKKADAVNAQAQRQRPSTIIEPETTAT